jgi:putative membrane protein
MTMRIFRGRRRIGHFLVAAVAVAALSGCSSSRQQPSVANTNTNAGPATPAMRATRRVARAKPAATLPAVVSSESSSAAILTQIHQADLKEITIGKIADEKASTSEVRDYAGQLVEDHQTVDQAVVATAQKMKLSLHETATPKPKHRTAPASTTEEKLALANGASFDRLFLEQTSADHDKLIRALKQEREDASDDDIEALIDKILPILEQHEQLAQILLKKEQA